MAEIISLQGVRDRLDRPSARPVAGLADTLACFAETFLPSDTYQEVYREQGRSILIIAPAATSPVILSSDDASQLVTVEISLGSPRLDQREAVFHLLNEVNCQLAAGHAEYADDCIRYRNSCRIRANSPYASQAVTTRANLEFLSDFLKDARSKANEIQLHFSPLLT